MHDPSSQPPPMPYIPPTVPGALSTPRPAVWPTVLGVFGIVFGIAGMLGGLMGFLSPFFMEFLAKMSPQGEATVASAQKYMVAHLLYAGVSLAVAAMLLIGGVLLYKRRPAARPILLSWSVLKIIASLGGVILTHYMQEEQFRAMAAQPGMSPPFMKSMMSAFGIAALIAALLWAWALPTFMLVWFARRKVREQVASWPARTV